MTLESREFQVFVKPAGAMCNLTCSYCYYLDKKQLMLSGKGKRMSDETLETYIRQHIDASMENEVSFSWHGGEPTLAGLNFFRKAVEIQRKYNPSGRVIINGLQTNATLLNDKWGEFLKKEHFFVGISLDGPEAYHNAHRPELTGKGSFRDVINGLDILKKHQVPFEFLCVLSDANVHDPLGVYHFLKDIGGCFITFLPLVEHDPKGESGVSPHSVNPADFGRFLSAVFDEWLENDIGRVKVQIFEEALRSAFGQDHTLCIFRKRCGGVPVVEMNGDFYSCDHYVRPEHRIGNISDISLAEMLDHPRQRAFGELKWNSLPEFCKKCEVLDMCHGECPKNRFLTTPSGEAGLNYLCEGYRYFFNHCRPFVDEVARVWRM